MSSLATDHETSKTSTIENVVSNPLVAVVCMAENNNKDDTQAKLKDYENTLFVLNHIQKLNCVYQVESDGSEESEDEKKSEMNSKFVHLKQRIDSLDEIITTKFLTIWKKEELISFCEKVVKLLESKDYGYDSLIFVMTSYVEPKSIKRLADLHVIMDSYSNPIELKPLYSLFGKEKCTLDYETFPLIFMVDRYCQKDDKQGPNWRSNPFIKIDMDGAGLFHQFYGSQNPLIAPKSSEEGGIVTIAIKETLSKKPKGKKIKKNHVSEFFVACCDSIWDHAGRSATPVDTIPELPSMQHVSFGFWKDNH